MHLTAVLARNRNRSWPMLAPTWLLSFLLGFSIWATGVVCMTDDEIRGLRQDTVSLFYHGYDNYMQHAFPEDELKPLSCKPQTRNKENPADIGLNDVLGNYSLTLIDSLSTLAILASGSEKESGRKPLRDFQDGIKSLVEQYGDGSNTTTSGCGKRACGFDLDSKVQVFETNIRGVGGLLSAHLFAIGELPIRGYRPTFNKKGAVKWPNGFIYNSQLLNLALDLATRLLPAFSTQTGIPYPRVNLRSGIPFHLNTEGFCYADGSSSTASSGGQREITENCAAGAGSLILEFSTLSRLTGDPRFENLAKRAFWAIWSRRSSLNLLGNGIDAESGAWTNPPLSGIGAGIDSFFEYSLKSHILLSGLPSTDSSPDNFLEVWQQAHAAVKHHIYRSPKQEKHPFYAQVDTTTGAMRYSWIDNLSAYYPGLLVLAGETDEAIESHLLFSALWTRYAALPERWNTANGAIDPHFRHWAGRPEFVESTFHLFQATKDPWMLRVGEMALRDIRRRCWTSCGWADLGDVVSGERRDRMESFFLGETAKYFYLLFEERHPLNLGDGAVVFTTEGHPLVIPRKKKGSIPRKKGSAVPARTPQAGAKDPYPIIIPESGSITCPAPMKPLGLTVSNIANRPDLFHAAALVQLHQVPTNPTRSSELRPEDPSSGRPGISWPDIRSPTNYTFYPWTLPQSLIPVEGWSSAIVESIVSTLTFPAVAGEGAGNGLGGVLGGLQKYAEGVVIQSLSNLRLSLVQEGASGMMGGEEEVLRIQGIGGLMLGRDEMVFVSQEALKGLGVGGTQDPHFERVRDGEWVDLWVDVQAPPPLSDDDDGNEEVVVEVEDHRVESLRQQIETLLNGLLGGGGGGAAAAPSAKESVLAKARAALSLDPASLAKALPAKAKPAAANRFTIPAILPAGIGAAPVPAALDSDALPGTSLVYSRIFWLESELCEYVLPAHVVMNFEVVVIRRGGCSFSEKLERVPVLTPKSRLRVVVVLSGEGGGLARPVLSERQRTPNGLERRVEVGMVMVDDSLGQAGGVLRGACGGEGGWGASGEWWEREMEGKGGVGGRRRFWFESLGVRIGNLGML